MAGKRADGGKAMSYTNTPNNVEDEAEGKRRARGGRMADEEHGESAAEEAAEEAPKKRARGGALKHMEMEGVKTKMRRLDRPGRKRGGGVGADATPLSTAARTTEAGAHKADNDELSN
jgi:hypothetical protein